MLRPAHGRGGLVTFVATKVTKKAVSRNASLPHRPFPCKSAKTTGCKMLPHCACLPVGRFAPGQCFDNYCYALPALRATIVLPDFIRSCSADGENFKFIGSINEPKNRRALG
ncbi:hypothetical protein ACPPVU_04815 [Mucilaginibacter sp. McL0603]|uniref:hypothetical protein n=1 Tax=Mucilaginibacter sp. McL0603 TaxID=3415670 RepID=UPI003CEB93B0